MSKKKKIIFWIVIPLLVLGGFCSLVFMEFKLGVDSKNTHVVTLETYSWSSLPDAQNYDYRFSNIIVFPSRFSPFCFFIPCAVSYSPIHEDKYILSKETGLEAFLDIAKPEKAAKDIVNSKYVVRLHVGQSSPIDVNMYELVREHLDDAAIEDFKTRPELVGVEVGPRFTPKSSIGRYRHPVAMPDMIIKKSNEAYDVMFFFGRIKVGLNQIGIRLRHADVSVYIKPKN